MKFTDKSQIEDFLAVVRECKGDVILSSIYGDRYNLKSSLSPYLAVAALLGEHGDELELWCMDRNDEALFMKFFNEHPDVQSSFVCP